MDWPIIPDQNFSVYLGELSVFDDFEDGDADGWSGHGVMNAVTDPVNPNGGTYVGQTDLAATSDCYGQWRSLGHQTPDHFSYDFLSEGDTGHPSGVAVSLRSSDGTMTLISLHQGNLRWAEGGGVYHTIMAASLDTWYRIELRNIDWVLGTYDIWVDGVEQYVGATFMDPVTYMDTIQLYGCPSYTDAVVSLDNIAFGTGGSQGVQGYQWPVGVSVDLSVQHPDGSGGWVSPAFHTDTALSMEIPEWGPGQTAVDFVMPDGTVIAPGDLVTLSGDGVTKDHVVEAFTFTVNTGDDTVTGVAAPSSAVDVGIHDDPGAQRSETADASTGAFTADFATPGDEGHEQDPYDITDDTQGQVSVTDPDNDSTVLGFAPLPEPPVPDFTVHRDSGDVWGGGGWLPMSPITVTLGDPAAPDGSFVRDDG